MAVAVGIGGTGGCVRINEGVTHSVVPVIEMVWVTESVPDMVAIEFLLKDQTLVMGRDTAFETAQATVDEFNQRHAGFAEASVSLSSRGDIVTEYRFPHGVSAEVFESQEELRDLDQTIVGLLASMRSMSVVIRVDRRGGITGYDRSWTFVDLASDDPFTHELEWSSASAGVYSRAYELLPSYGPIYLRSEPLVLVDEMGGED